MTEDRGSLSGRRVVVGVAGSIAAYKAVSLVRLLAERGAIVDVAMTPAATQFVTPLTFASLTHRRVVDDVMALDAEQQIAHVELAEGADAIVIAPATANLLAELAAGNAGNAVTAIALASRAPLVVAPAMVAGWVHIPASIGTSRRCAASATSSSSPRSGRLPAASPGSGAWRNRRRSSRRSSASSPAPGTSTGCRSL